jgi:uncharacterized protein YeaC (DUF1315 family)
MNDNLTVASIFHAAIEKIVVDKRCTYMEAVMLYQAEANVEIETVASLVKTNSQLKSFVQSEAEDLNLVAKTVTKLRF